MVGSKLPHDNMDWIMQSNNFGKSFIMKLNVSSGFYMAQTSYRLFSLTQLL